ncbi:NAD(P)H-dependent flavin oxidoreductase [Pseudorhodoplanes sp.]|uniref:NAD(P)H-dependent flavin oxidoreductase n=1 Tax=Pseudorhodoplanes sp. TaxID=1934341 RepID=UPI003D0DBD44
MRNPLFSTRLTRLLGISHPILCGGLMHLADARYVAAVVNAGGMGFITALSFPDQMKFREELRLCRELTSGKPFGVCLSVSRRKEANDRLPRFVDTLLDAGVRIIETSGHSPDIIAPRLKAAGCTVIHKAPSVRFALSAEKLGVDAVTLVGIDGGGHPGMDIASSFAMAPLASERLKIPFAIAGGIGTGRQILAALAAGADGVLLGSRMLAAAEIWAHPEYKQQLLRLDERDTRLVLASFQNNHRVLANDTAKMVADMEAERIAEIERYLPLMSGALTRNAYESGDLREGLIDLGPAVAYVREQQTVEQIFDDLLDDAKAASDRVQGLTATSGNPRARRLA